LLIIVNGWKPEESADNTLKPRLVEENASGKDAQGRREGAVKHLPL
jgi:hypothetical protein